MPCINMMLIIRDMGRTWLRLLLEPGPVVHYHAGIPVVVELLDHILRGGSGSVNANLFDDCTLQTITI